MIQFDIIFQIWKTQVSFDFKQDLLRALRIIDVISLYTSYANHWAPLCVRSYQLLMLSDRYGIVSTFPSDHTALILVFGLNRLNYLCQSILFEEAVGSLFEHGWKDGKFGLELILFEDQMSSDFLQDLVCTCKGRSVCSKGCEDLRTCCLNVSSLGGSLTKVESLTVANFTRNLFRSIWHRFDFPFGSYSLDISFRLRSTELSMSEHSIREKYIIFQKWKTQVSFGFKQDLLRALRIIDDISLYTSYASHWASLCVRSYHAQKVTQLLALEYVHLTISLFCTKI
jgi:hypothetical protein